MDITSNLLAFLQKHNQATLGSFGRFSKKKITGYFDKNEKAFSPPSFKLDFDGNDSEEDDKFLEFVSNENSLSVEKSIEAIAAFVSGIKASLEKNQKASISGLGTFSLGENDTILFDAEKGLLVDASYFGMPNVSEESQISSPAKEPINLNVDNQTKTPPIIENIELDEVKTDLANTLAHLDTNKINTETEESQAPKDKKSAEEFPVIASENTSHETKDEEDSVSDNHIDTSIVEPPLTEGETKDILDIEPLEEDRDEVVKPAVFPSNEDVVEKDFSQEQITEAPVFIKEQHEQHPERFGTDPMEHPTEKSIWPKVLITAIVLLIIGGLVYFFQPNLFTHSTDSFPKVITPVDSIKIQTRPIATAQRKQDSIKTDSILKVNGVQSPKRDSVIGQNIANNEPIFTFDVIVASYKTEKAANQYISMMKRNGYDAKIANMTGTRKKISIASFTSEQEAKKQLIILQRKLRGKGFYVQKIKTP